MGEDLRGTVSYQRLHHSTSSHFHLHARKLARLRQHVICGTSGTCLGARIERTTHVIMLLITFTSKSKDKGHMFVLVHPNDVQDFMSR